MPPATDAHFTLLIISVIGASFLLYEMLWNNVPVLWDAKLESTQGAREVALMRRTVDDALISLEGLARLRDAKGAFKVADNNLRDQRMAESLENRAAAV